MQYLMIFLINGFLLSITPSTVTDSKCTNQSPVLLNNCNDIKPTPLVLPQPPPQPQNGVGDIKKNNEEKNVASPDCAIAKTC